MEEKVKEDEVKPVEGSIQDFQAGLAKAMAIAGAVVIPPGLVLSGVFGGWKGLAGAFVGFGVASLYTVLMVLILKWALKKPPRMIQSILIASYFGRLVLLAGILYSLHFIKALNMVALLLCFLALYIAHTGVEMYFAVKSFGVVMKQQKKEDD